MNYPRCTIADRIIEILRVRVPILGIDLVIIWCLQSDISLGEKPWVSSASVSLRGELVMAVFCRVRDILLGQVAYKRVRCFVQYTRILLGIWRGCRWGVGVIRVRWDVVRSLI
jgi:hypothetical protein